MKIDINSPDVAEALYVFVAQTDTTEDFFKKSFEHDLSIAEYVAKFKYPEFCNWYKSNYLN